MMRRYDLKIGEQRYRVDVQELADDRFSVVIGDTAYDVALTGDQEENLAITPGPAAAQNPPSRTDAPSHAASPALPPPRAAAGRKDLLAAPMPGVILEMRVKPGDTVTRGQPVAILDAMKMHNVIGAPRAGTIAEVFASAGQNVNHGDALIRYTED